MKHLAGVASSILLLPLLLEVGVVGCADEARTRGQDAPDAADASRDLGGGGSRDLEPVRPEDGGADADLADLVDDPGWDAEPPLPDTGRLAPDAADLPPDAADLTPDAADLTPDATELHPDLARDAGAEAGPPDQGAGDEDGGLPACDPADPGSADRERVVLLSHPFGAAVGEPGTTIRSLTLKASSPLPVDDGVRLDVGMKVARLALLPRGDLALALGEDGQLVAVRVAGAGDLAVVDQVALPAAGYGDLVVAPDGRTVYVVGSNVDASRGLSLVRVACDGTLTVDGDRFFPLRLSESLVLHPAGERAVVLGGQAVFEPVDDDDTRLLSLLPGGGFVQRQPFDLWSDFVSCGKMALSPDGRTLLVPNASLFSVETNQVMVVQVGDGGLVETQRLTDLETPAEVLFAPDGRTALVSLFEANRVAVLADQGAGLEVVDLIAGIGLPEQLALVSRGRLAGTVLLPSVDTSGISNVAVLRITGPGQVEDLGQVDLGGGYEQIPRAIAVTP